MQFFDNKKSPCPIFVFKKILAYTQYKDILIKIYYKQIVWKKKQQLHRKVKYWMEDMQAA